MNLLNYLFSRMGLITYCHYVPYYTDNSKMCTKCSGYGGRIKEKPCMKHQSERQYDKPWYCRDCGWKFTRIGSVLISEPSRKPVDNSLVEHK